MLTVKFIKSVAACDAALAMSVTKDDVIEEIQVAADWRQGKALHGSLSTQRKLQSYETGFLGDGHTKVAIYVGHLLSRTRSNSDGHLPSGYLQGL
jgi:hypothetical protein